MGKVGNKLDVTNKEHYNLGKVGSLSTIKVITQVLLIIYIGSCFISPLNSLQMFCPSSTLLGTLYLKPLVATKRFLPL